MCAIERQGSNQQTLCCRRPTDCLFCPKRARSLQFDMRINSWKDGLAHSLLLNVLVDLQDDLTLLLWHVLITPAPYRMAAIARANYSLHHNVAWHWLEVIRPANQWEEVDKRRGDVQSVVSQFGSFVVPREGVVVVVPSLSQRQRCDRVALGRVDVPKNINLAR